MCDICNDDSLNESFVEEQNFKFWQRLKNKLSEEDLEKMYPNKNNVVIKRNDDYQ